MNGLCECVLCKTGHASKAQVATCGCVTCLQISVQIGVRRLRLIKGGK